MERTSLIVEIRAYGPGVERVYELAKLVIAEVEVMIAWHEYIKPCRIEGLGCKMRRDPVLQLIADQRGTLKHIPAIDDDRVGSET